MIFHEVATFALVFSCFVHSANSFAPAPGPSRTAFVRNDRVNTNLHRTIRPMAANTYFYWDKQASKYEEVFRDDFDGDSLNTKVWTHEIGPGPGNGEVQYYTDQKDNAYVENSVLHVKALRNREYNGTVYDWTSARLNTKKSFSFTFGRMSAKIRCKPEDGPFSAVWALSTKDSDPDFTWPRCGEIDIFEMQSLWEYTPATLHFQEHYGGNALSYFSYETFKSVDDWHVYGVEWVDAKHIAFYHDGKRIGEYPIPVWKVGQENWPYHWENPFYLIINNAMNPNWGTKAQDDLKEHDLEVDWICVEQLKEQLKKNES